MKIVKVGGGVLSGFESICQLPDVLAGLAEPYVLVVSAFGKTTNALERSVQLALDEDIEAALRRLEEILYWHEQLTRQLKLPDSTLGVPMSFYSGALQSMAEWATTQSRAAFRDHLLSFGEELSSHVVAAFLQSRGLAVSLSEAAGVITTDEDFGRAAPLRPLADERIRAVLEPPLRRGEIPVMAGFVGATREGVKTTLGREGSDYTAALVAAALDANELILLKGVEGVMSADPTLVPSACLIPYLSFDQAERLFRAGAKVVHPKTIGPVREKDISVCVQRFGGRGSGTLMRSTTTWQRGKVHAVVGNWANAAWNGSPTQQTMPACNGTPTARAGLACLTVVGEPPIEGRCASQIVQIMHEVGSEDVVYDQELTAWHGWVVPEQGQHGLIILHDELCLHSAGRGRYDEQAVEK